MSWFRKRAATPPVDLKADIDMAVVTDLARHEGDRLIGGALMAATVFTRHRERGAFFLLVAGRLMGAAAAAYHAAYPELPREAFEAEMMRQLAAGAAAAREKRRARDGSGRC